MEEEGIKRGANGQFLKGVKGHTPGRPKDTPESRAMRRATQQIIAEYKQALVEALPLIQPALVAKAMEGDVPAIKEIHDRTMDKARQVNDLNVTGELQMVFDNTFNELTSETEGGY